MTTNIAQIVGVRVLIVVGGVCGVGGCVRAPEPGEPIPTPKVIGSIGDSPGRFMYPRAMEFSSNGLWVIDRSGRVQRIDVSTGYCTGLFRMPGRELGMPTGLFIGPGLDASGKPAGEVMYIADTHYHRVLVVRTPVFDEVDKAKAREFVPEVLREVGTFGTGPGEFTYPTDVAVLYDADAITPVRYYVSEYGGNDRVSIFSGDWTFRSSFGSFGGAGESSDSREGRAVRFHRPQSIAICAVEDQLRVVVSDSANHRLGVFSIDGELVRWIGGRAPGVAGDVVMPSTIDMPRETSAGPVQPAVVGQAATFLFPYGVAALSDGTAMVSEFGASRIQRVRLSDGRCLGSWGRAGRRIGELAVPWDVHVHAGKTYALDSGNNRLQAFDAPAPPAPAAILTTQGAQP